MRCKNNDVARAESNAAHAYDKATVLKAVAAGNVSLRSRAALSTLADRDHNFFANGFWDNDGAPRELKPWSVEDRWRSLAPITNLFDTLTEAEVRRWSLVTIVVAAHWVPRGQLTAAHVRNAKRQLVRQLSKSANRHITAAFVLDLIVTTPFGMLGNEVGTQLHFHGAIRIPFSDKNERQRFRRSLKQWARANRAIKLEPVEQEKGGITGRLRYSLKDWNNPLKPVPGRPKVKQPCNNAVTGEMRAFLRHSGLQPDDLLVLRHIKRWGSIAKFQVSQADPAPDPATHQSKSQSPTPPPCPDPRAVFKAHSLPMLIVRKPSRPIQPLLPLADLGRLPKRPTTVRISHGRLSPTVKPFGPCRKLESSPDGKRPSERLPAEVDRRLPFPLAADQTGSKVVSPQNGEMVPGGQKVSLGQARKRDYRNGDQ